MELVIDHESLENIINEEVSDLIKKPYYTETNVTIGRFRGLELQITVTREEDDFNESDNFICVTVG